MSVRGNQQGFSLVEVLVAFLVMASDAEIVTLDLTYSKATDVVQCVLSSESLSDLAMETFRKRVPR